MFVWYTNLCIQNLNILFLYAHLWMEGILVQQCLYVHLSVHPSVSDERRKKKQVVVHNNVETVTVSTCK